MRYLILFILIICFKLNFFGQTQQISWRLEASSGELFETNPCGEIGTGSSQWWYPHFAPNNSRNAPNCFGTYDIVFDNNHELSMNNSESYFDLNRITFNAGNSLSRTINGSGIDLVAVGLNRPIIRNNSTAKHIINTPLALQSSPVEFNPVNGDLEIQNSVFTNGNFIDVFGDNANTLTLSGVISGTGGIALKENSTIEIAAAMTYTGGTAIEDGTLQLLTGGNLSDDTAVTVSTGGTFDLNDQNVTVRSVSETGTGNGGTIDLGSGTLTIDGNYTGDRFQNTIVGTGNLIKNGNGNWVLYGNNTFSGTTTINAGTLRINASNGLGTTTGLVTVNSGAALEFNAEADYPAQNIVLSGTGIANAGAWRKIDTGNRSFAGDVTLNSDTRFNATGGTLEYDGALNLNGNTMYFGGTQNFQFRSSSSFTNAIKATGDGAFFKDGTGILWIRPTTNLTGNITLVSGEIRQYTGNFPTSGKVIIRGGTYRSDGSTTRTIQKDVDVEGNFTLGHASGGEMIISGDVDLTGVNRSITTPNNNRINGIISNGGITKLGTGTLSLAGVNTYSGTTNIQSGTLRLLTGADLSNDTDINISLGATLDLNNVSVTVNSVSETGSNNGGTISLGTGNLTIAGDFLGTRFQNSISGTGNLIKNGAGTLSLYGTQSFTGSTTINNGVLATGVDLASSEVIVNASGTFSITSNQEVDIQDLTLASGATLNLDTGSILNVTGEFIDNGVNITGSGELRVIRNSLIDGDWSSGSSWDNGLIPNSDYDYVTINHNLNIDADYTVKRLLLETGNKLTVKSNHVLSVDGTLTINDTIIFENTNATDAAQIGEVSSTSVIDGTGHVILERFIPASRAFRLFASGVNTTSSIQDNWQEGANSYSANPNPNHGTHITGFGTANSTPVTTNQNGFDWNPSGNPSLFTFDNTAGSYGWNAIPNTNTQTISAQEVYRLFVRGDRSIDIQNNNAVPTSTTIRTIGTLNHGSNSINLNTGTEIHNLIPNPYHAIIDVQTILQNATNLNTRYFWVWDPTLSARGAFVVVDLDTNSPENPITFDPETNSSANRYVMPGQSFVVYSTAANPTLSIEESHKATAQAQTDVFSDGNEVEETRFINIRLYFTDAFDNEEPPSDALAVRFKASGNNLIDDNDAPKLMNTNENISVLDHGKIIQIEERALPQVGDEIQLLFDNKDFEEYTFDIDMDCNQNGLKLVLVDQYTQETYDLENGNQHIDVSIDYSINASIAMNRFKLVFEEEPLNTNEFSDLNFSIYPNPVKDDLHIKISENLTEAIEVSILNLVGKKMLSYTINNNKDQFEIPVHHLPSGIYLLKLENLNINFAKKFIKQ